MKTYVVVGLGRFGAEVARQLCRQGCEVLAMDTSGELVQQVADQVTHAVVADATDKSVLKALDIDSFDCAIVAIGGSLSDSVLTVMNLQELGVGEIICKAHDETHRKVLQKLGITRVLIPEQEMADRLARRLTTPNVMDYMELGGEYGIMEVPAPAKWIGRSLKELDVRAKLGINIIAVKHDGVINPFPAGDYRFAPGDVIVVLGDNETMDMVQKL